MRARKSGTLGSGICLVAFFLFSSATAVGGGLKPGSGCGCPGPGTGTPGYWMNHPEAWPCLDICVGGVGYAMAEAIDIMWEPTKGDKTLTLFPALVAAKLNVKIGNKDCCIKDTIAKADEWLSMYPVQSGVRANSDAWQGCGETLYKKLDAYNNGRLCAPSRDSLE